MVSTLERLTLKTNKQFELVDITEQVRKVVADSGVKSGVALVYNPHTTAALRLTQNEPLLMQDLMKMVYRLVPLDISYSHDLFEVRQNVAVNERTNGHAHVKSFLLGSSESLIVEDGKMMIGEYQSLFFVELDGGRSRDYFIKIIGE